MNTRVMPDRVELGSGYNGPLSSATRFASKEDRFPNPEGHRTVLGWVLPPWQRGFVWTEEQCIRFMESVWKGMPLGSYTVNLLIGSRFDGWLIDGQQRMRALERYLNNEFPVLGYRWNEVTAVDRRVFDSSLIWNYYETRSDNEEYLKGYYNLMNFGGTPHKEHERA